MTNHDKAQLTIETGAITLDALVRRISAFQTFEAAVAQCRTGYVPTIIPRALPANASVNAHLDELAKAMLISGLEALGLKVWKGVN